MASARLGPTPFRYCTGRSRSFDFFTGPELSFGVFYLIPVSLAAWQVNAKTGIWVSMASAFIWFTIELVTRAVPYSHPTIPVWNAATRFAFFIVVAVLIAKLRAQLEKEKASARTDALTGAGNARAFFDSANFELTRARRYNHPLSIAFLDVDDFKAVNDQYGHARGDAVLCSTVQAIRKSLRSTDVIARLGGDEFAVLLPETGPEAAWVVGQKIHESLLFEARHQGFPVTYSIGLLTCTEPDLTVDEMLLRVDAVMYAAKRSGKSNLKHEVLAATHS